MEEKRTMSYTEKLAKLLFVAGILAVVIFLANYFGSILADIGVAIVVSLIAKPLVGILAKIKIKGKSAPYWLLSLISILFILLVLTALVAGLIPVIAKVAADISLIGGGEGMVLISANLASLNEFLVQTFQLDRDFQLESAILDQINSASDFGVVRKVLGSVASTTISFFIGLFSVVFISFFLIKDEKMLNKVFLSLTPDCLEEKVSETVSDVENLLSRYFVGLLIEMTCVGLIDFIGLWLVAGLDFESAIGIGFFAGLMNIIPYLGPVLGGVFGTSMGVVIKFAGAAAAPSMGSFWTFVVIMACVFLVSKLIDDFVFQPVIYSKSIKSHPLEIFLVLLIAGTMAGVVGMLVAIPAYTVIRVIAVKFFPDVKYIKALASAGNSKDKQ